MPQKKQSIPAPIPTVTMSELEIWTKDVVNVTKQLNRLLEAVPPCLEVRVTISDEPMALAFEIMVALHSDSAGVSIA